CVWRRETVDHNMSTTELGVDERGFSVGLGAAKQPAREQRVPTCLIRRDSRCLRWIRDLECGAVLYPSDGAERRELLRDRMVALELDAEDRARSVKLRVRHPGEDILHRQLQRV